MIYCTLRIAARIFNGKHQSLKYLKHFYFFLYQAQITECHSFFFSCQLLNLPVRTLSGSPPMKTPTQTQPTRCAPKR